MAGLEYRFTVPRRQAMLLVRESKVLRKDLDIGYYAEHVDEYRVPVFVWPMPTPEGQFIVESRDGKCQKAWPHEITFIDSEELFDQYDWSEA